jgi:homoserine dehydrogenase
MENPLRLGVAGLGVVGTSLVQLLQRRSSEFVARAGRECVLAAYSARRKRDAGAGLGKAQFFENAAAMAASADIDAFVELIGGADGVAFEAVKAALARGLPVVTANKTMLAAHGLELANLSESHKAPL